MIEVTPEIQIDESELQFVFSRSSGPGGQNVNKVATAVQLRFDVAASASLPEDVKRRLAGLAGSRMTQEGVLVINARRRRTQERNRRETIDRLVELVRRASRKPKRRVETKPPPRSKEKRLEEKRHRSRIKQKRGRVNGDEE